MSVSAPHPPANGETAGHAAATSADVCPLCGAQLDPIQDWCLRCGSAARTRLASAPNWRVPIIVVAVIGVLALAILAVALVKLAGKSGTAVSTSTLSVATTAATSTAVSTTTAAPAVTTTTLPALSSPAATGTAGSNTKSGTGSSALTPAQEQKLREALQSRARKTSGSH